jgi:regulator of protease activity HflC (stomatin/prohibitin superfamily)
MKFLTRNNIIGGVSGLLLLLTLLGSISIIPSGSVGVKSTFGKIDNGVLSPGLNLVLPFVQTVNTISVLQTQIDEKFAVQTKDSQLITVTGIAVVNVNPNNAAKTAARVSSNTDQINKVVLQPKLLAVTKSVISGYTMTDSISQQSAISTQIQTELAKLLIADGALDFDGFNITGFVLDPDVQKSIEAKQIASQQKLRKQIELETADLENKRLELIGKALTPLLVQQQLIDKWDGKSLINYGNTPLIVNAGK